MRNCINCKTKIISKNNYFKYRKYCSVACQKKLQYLTYIDKWLKGKIDGGIKGGYVSHYIKRYLIQIYKKKCSQCCWDKLNRYSKRVPLEVDHIDGNCENNKLENLRLLCPNCHSLTKTYKALNMGNGRVSRKIHFVIKC